MNKVAGIYCRRNTSHGHGLKIEIAIMEFEKVINNFTFNNFRARYSMLAVVIN